MKRLLLALTVLGSAHVGRRRHSPFSVCDPEWAAPMPSRVYSPAPCPSTTAVTVQQKPRTLTRRSALRTPNRRGLRCLLLMLEISSDRL